MPPSIAIIMRSKNEMPYVQQALQMLERQTVQSFDLFAIDSGSTDGSLEALNASSATVKEIAPESYVPGQVLNEAVAGTSHEIIVLLNADAVPQSEDWLEQLVAPIIGQQADATFSKQIARPDARFIVSYDYERAYNAENITTGFYSAVSCAFTRQLWESHPFPECGYAEDSRWAITCIREFNARSEMVEGSVVEHSHNYSLKELYAKRRRQSLARPVEQTVMSLLKEIIRDSLFAVRKLQILTIPYNIAYRTTIYRGFRDGRKNRTL